MDKKNKFEFELTEMSFQDFFFLFLKEFSGTKNTVSYK